MQRILFTLFIYLLIALSSAQASEKNAQAWKLEEKEVPIPSGSSKSLQNSLRAIEQPDVAARLKQTPENRKQWDQMIFMFGGSFGWCNPVGVYTFNCSLIDFHTHHLFDLIQWSVSRMSPLRDHLNPLLSVFGCLSQSSFDIRLLNSS